MVAVHDPDGADNLYTFSHPDLDTAEALTALRAAGIEGGSASDGSLYIVQSSGRPSNDQLDLLAARYGTPVRVPVRAEFVEGDPRAARHAPIKEIQAIRQRYAEEHGLDPRAPLPHLSDADDMAAADAYIAAPHSPNDPRVRASYDHLITHIGRQYEAMHDAGYRFEAWQGESEQPYADSAQMLADLRDNRHLYYFRTEVSQDAPNAMPADHPMAATIRVPDEHGGAKLIVANDALRAVHDAIAHGEGYQFGPQGERRAWWAHRTSLPREARLALWNEFRAQNTFTNHGTHMRNPDGSLKKPGEPGYLGVAERPYADQKTVWVPDHLI